MKPFFLLRLQKAWHFLEPLVTSAIKCFPKLINLVLFRVLAKVFRVRSIAVDGDQGMFFGSPLDLGVFGRYLMRGTYSPDITGLILKTFEGKNGGTFVDIGANIGLITVPVARAGIDCISFEPDPENFEFLKRNVEAAGVAAKVTLYNLAIYDREAQLSFEKSDWNFGDHRIRNVDQPAEGIFGEQHRRVIAVDATTLDGKLAVGSLKKPIVIKIDTEGAEVNVFRGGKNFLAQSDLIIFEYCPYLIRRLGENEGALIEFAERNFKYGLILSDDTEGGGLVFSPIAEILARLRSFTYRPSNPGYLDIVLSNCDLAAE